MTKYPFETSESELIEEIDLYVDCVFSSLESEFLTMPKGNGFLEYATFEKAYERLKRETKEFHSLDAGRVFTIALVEPVVMIVLRAILGFTPSEWAYAAQQQTGIPVSQGQARSFDRDIRLNPHAPLHLSSQASDRVQALVSTACDLLSSRRAHSAEGMIHRLDKADTADGITSLRAAARLGLPYSMVLYERVLGRPFASHRDSVSELVGATLELAIETLLARAGVSFRKTGRAERIPGFDQAPDFSIPNEFNPAVLIEAKLTEDDGTARDKVTRIQHLAELAKNNGRHRKDRIQVIACIGGRGFAVRREDMKKLLLATEGKVFTLQTLDRLVDATRVGDYRTRSANEH